ncbi:hypothetical protein [Streptomyces sp. NPDC058620]|uniref:hypothetical protein n=1 Tax=Streptomyces sp. NPDC058620 TaxID=3346560 RepID=UPI0036505724
MTTPATPARTTVPAPSVREPLISGLIGGAIGAVMSAGINYLLVGMPDSEGVNAVNHAISGLMTGFLAGFAGLLAYQRKAAALARKTAAEVPPEQ